MCFNRLVLFAMLTSLATSSSSQPFERIATYRLHYHMPSDYLQPETAGAEKFSLVQNTVNVVLPVPFKIKKRESLFITGVFYNRYNFSSKTGGASVTNRDFDRLTFRFGISHKWKNARHKTLLMGLPTFSTDGKIFTSDAFQMGGVFIHSFAVNENLTLKLGLYYNHEFFGDFYMPLFGVDWRLKNDWYIFGILPGSFNVYKQVNDWLAFSFSERAPTGSLLSAHGDGDFVRFGEDAYVILALNAHFIPFQFDFLDNDADISFNLSVGHTVFRTYDLFIEGDLKIESPPFYPAKNGVYLQFGMSMRVWQ